MIQIFNSFNIFIVGMVVVMVSCKLITIRQGDDSLWNEFKTAYKRNYTNDIDFTKRSLWEKYLSEIMEHNLGFYNGSRGYSQGLNQFSDMSDNDFRSFSLGLEEKLECENKSLIYTPPADASLPDSINWVERGYVTEVLNQGSCGACWAFSSIGALEGQHKRITGNLVKLSEQQLIDCSTITGNKQCQGGQMCRAYEYASMPSVGGVDYEKDYPLTDKGGECKFSQDNIGSTIKGYLEIPKGDEYALQSAVALIGPVAAGIDGFRQSFRHYKNGIYDDPLCSNTTVNHAVTIVGYGTEKGKDYWLIKNSWSTQWGDDGYGKIARNNNLCGIANTALFPVLEDNSEGEPILTGPKAE